MPLFIAFIASILFCSARPPKRKPLARAISRVERLSLCEAGYSDSTRYDEIDAQFNEDFE